MFGLRRHFALILALGICLCPGQLITQNNDSLTLIVLSPRVGPVVGAEDRERYHLFLHVNQFDSAVVLKNSHGVYRVVVMATANGLPADIVLPPYREFLLISIAEKIEHYEDIERGTYTIGSAPPSLQTGDPNRIPLRARTAVRAFLGEVRDTAGFRYPEQAISFASSGMGDPAVEYTITFTTRNSLNECKVVAVQNDVLTLVRPGGVTTVGLDSVLTISRPGAGHFWAGAGIGAFVGLAAGIIIGANNTNADDVQPPVLGEVFIEPMAKGAGAAVGAVIGLAGGFLLGGGIGSSIRDTDSLNLHGVAPGERAALVRMFLTNR